jgi:hypothetical protein
MHAKPAALLLLLMLLVPAGGCLPRTTVHKNPGADDCGVRYYRPKPYLMVKPMTDHGGLPVDGHVQLEQVILPDFSEEYSIHVRSGLGTNDTEISLEDGWNLTALNVDIDSQFDENLKAVADVIEAVPRATAAAIPATPSMVVRATNIPLGLYEAVVSTGADCKKRLYGFRYVGFMPYATCPLESCGLEQTSCCTGDIYGLAMEEGVMVFRRLDEIATQHGSKRVSLRDASELLQEDREAEPLQLDRPARLPTPAHAEDRAAS